MLRVYIVDKYVKINLGGSKLKKFFLTFIVVFGFSVFFSPTSKAANLEYLYDSNNQLIGISENNVLVVSFDYDLNGNLLSQSILPISTPKNSSIQFGNHLAIISWDPTKNASSYDIFVNNTYYLTVMGNSVTVNDLKSDTLYTIEIKAKNSFTKNETGLVFSFTKNFGNTLPGIPDEPITRPDPNPCRPGKICIKPPIDPVLNTTNLFNVNYISHFNQVRNLYSNNFVTQAFSQYGIAE